MNLTEKDLEIEMDPFFNIHVCVCYPGDLGLVVDKVKIVLF